MSTSSSTTSAKPAAAPHQKLPWNPWWGIVFALIVFFGAQLFGGIIVSIYPALEHWTTAHANDWLNNSVLAQFIYICLAEAITVGGVYLFLKRHRLSLASIGLKKPRLSDPLYAFAAAPVYFGIYLITVAVITHFVPSLNVNEKQQIGFNTVHGAPQMIMTFISLVILPPLAEEILVRGFIYSNLRKIFRLVPAAILTSLLFASAHLPEGGAAGPLYIAAIDTFILSLVLIYLREKTGNLWAGIMLHALKNGIAFIALFVAANR